MLDPTLSALSKPYLVTDLALSFANYSGIAPTEVLVSAFYNCATASACGGSANLSDLYYNSPLSNGSTAGADMIIALITYNQAALVGYSSSSNAITPVLTAGYATALMHMDMSNPLYSQAADADTYMFVPSVPVTLVSLMQDSVVTRKNSDVAFAYFEKQNPSGPYKEDLVNNADFSVSDCSPSVRWIIPPSFPS